MTLPRSVLGSLNKLQQQTGTQGQVLNLLLTEVDEDPANVRTRYRDIEGLAQSINEQGLKQPPGAVRLPSGRYQLIFGHRRLRAMRLLNWERAPILLLPEATPNDVLAQLTENIQRDDLGPLDVARALKRIMAMDETLSQRKLAEKIGKTPEYVSTHLKLLELPEAITSLAERELVTYPRRLIELSKLDQAALASVTDRLVAGEDYAVALAARSPAPGEVSAAAASSPASPKSKKKAVEVDDRLITAAHELGRSLGLGEPVVRAGADGVLITFSASITALDLAVAKARRLSAP
jgi:ParB/RepB/Spo0J family partition protein